MIYLEIQSSLNQQYKAVHYRFILLCVEMFQVISESIPVLEILILGCLRFSEQRTKWLAGTNLNGREREEGWVVDVLHSWNECPVTITHTNRALESFSLPPWTIAKQGSQQVPHTKKICFQSVSSYPLGIPQQSRIKEVLMEKQGAMNENIKPGDCLFACLC